MPLTIREQQGLRFIDTRPGQDASSVLLLHGLFGGSFEWSETIRALNRNGYRVVLPIIPLDQLPDGKTNVLGAVDYVRSVVEALGLDSITIIGNSLGGQMALFYYLRYPESVNSLVLAGSSGIHEETMGATSIRRHDKEFIRERATRSFFDPNHVTADLVDRIHTIVSDRTRALRMVKMVRSSAKENLQNQLSRVRIPTQLIWGRNDEITPPHVGVAFAQLLPSAELHFIDNCGHAPMKEHPDTFNALALEFLQRTIGVPDPHAMANASA